MRHQSPTEHATRACGKHSIVAPASSFHDRLQNQHNTTEPLPTALRPCMHLCTPQGTLDKLMLSHHAQRAPRDTCALPIISLQRTTDKYQHSQQQHAHHPDAVLVLASPRSEHAAAADTHASLALLLQPGTARSSALCPANQMHELHTAFEHHQIAGLLRAATTSCCALHLQHCMILC